MYAVDLHLHTRPFHNPRGAPTAFDPYGAKLMAATARNRGLDGLALTNHDYSVPYSNADPVFVPGIEVTTRHGHVLVVGPDPPRRTHNQKPHPADVVEDAHERGCAAIIAHPFRDSTVMKVDAPFDAVEINGKHPERKPNIDRIAEERGIPVVGGSDAHFPFELGRVHTLVDADELTPESLVAAIRDGRVEPGRRTYLTDRVLLPMYDAIHDVRDFANRALPG
ncbi:CehA/McbA family metallohydrolase [Halosimplex salinum]|uniref:CehA/McbA family metallohydrolase n=1 Tax=Halosimplex salinum TaxID=1710538 RepID=UPI000F4A8B0B|nr:CehA/McbA family metallohydrolase [Halosimplex salinum]